MTKSASSAIEIIENYLKTHNLTLGYDFKIENSSSWMRLYTKSRIIFRDHREQIADILVNNGYVVRSDSIHNYGLFCVRSITPDKSLRTMCMSDDPRADQDLFDIVREHGYDIDGGYQWTEQGAELSTYKEPLKDAIVEIFKDCSPVVRKDGKGRGRYWVIAITFPV